MRYSISLSAVICCLILFQSDPFLANDAPVNLEAGGARALNWPLKLTVEMESETVRIILGQKSYVVDARFNFRNKGETIEVDVGFPKNGEGYFDKRFPHTSDFIKFETWVDSVQVDFVEKPNKASIEGSFTLPDLVKKIKQTEKFDDLSLSAKDYRWMVKERVRFPSNKITTTRVRYEAQYNYGGGECKGTLAYIYGTGKYWNGNIGKSTFIIDATGIPNEDRPPRKAIHFSNENDKSKAKWKTLNDGIMQFVIQNYKPKTPDDGISVSIGCTHWD